MQNVHVLHHTVFFQNTTGFRINFPFAFMGISRLVYVPWVNLSIAVAESLESTIYYCSTIEDSKKHVVHCKRLRLYISRNSFCSWILSSLEYFPQQKFNILGKKLKFAATLCIFYNFQIQKRMIFEETICGRTINWF